MLKQLALWGGETVNKKYTTKIEAPMYKPAYQKPHLMELCDSSKTNELIKKIKASSVSSEEKEFLIKATKRHNIFNYKKIADYYAHSTPEMQELMEDSALVIIDFEKAIELGYIDLCNDIKEQYLTEYIDNEK